ncbi:MAG: SUMF1/EgtB/PvdO family nonheme iron enzyme [Verrucomicrobiae bacterium]|nr:SUMF1/EgtB/PvdO family nonheme iron enzyme [Verrucomicrobiae bacterium]
MAETTGSSDDFDDLDFGPTIRGLQEGLKVFGRYSLVRKLGRGGMGVVWLARDESLDGREVALKFLPDTMYGDEMAMRDLKRETLQCLELTHSHIVRIYDWIEDGHAAAISMEYVAGETLTTRRLAKASEVFEVGEIREWVGQLCAALGYAHEEKKIVHRDLKPANLMVDGSGKLRVLDFGISGSLTDSMSRLSAAAIPVSGTLVYMSPQQAMGYPPSVADDVYALGATIYELLTGKPPFFRGNIQHQIETLEPPTMAERREQLGVKGVEAIPSEWEEGVAACLAKDPAERPESVEKVWEQLNEPSVENARSKKVTPSRDPKEPRLKLKPETVSDRKMLKRNVVLLGLVAIGAVVAIVHGGLSIKHRMTGGDTREFDLGNGEKLVMKYVPGGTFMMGSPEDELLRSDKEAQVEATLRSSYWMGETEVTQGQWEAVMGVGSNPSAFQGDRNLPVEQVSWEEAQAYVKKLNEMVGLPEGWAWSLPTEAQWERACRAGTKTAFSFGDRLSSRQANFDGNYSYPFGDVVEGPFLEKTAVVKSYEANDWGLYDMHGNVSEWCLDSWDGESKPPGGTDPAGTSGSRRVNRGADWNHFARYCRSASRGVAPPSYRSNELGFRVALSSLLDE